MGVPFLYLAAGVLAATAAAVVVGAAQTVAVAAAAEQDGEDDNPPNVNATEVVVTHNHYLQENLSNALIPWYSVAGKRCRRVYCNFLCAMVKYKQLF